MYEGRGYVQGRSVECMREGGMFRGGVYEGRGYVQGRSVACMRAGGMLRRRVWSV